MLSSCPITGRLISGPTSSQFMRPPSPPILGVSDAELTQSLSLANTFSQNLPLGNTFPQNLPWDNTLPQNLLSNTLPPQIIHKPNNQEITYRQNVMVRWLKPPTPPPSAPIIIRGRFNFCFFF